MHAELWMETAELPHKRYPIVELDEYNIREVRTLIAIGLSFPEDVLAVTCEVEATKS